MKHIITKTDIAMNTVTKNVIYHSLLEKVYTEISQNSEIRGEHS